MSEPPTNPPYFEILFARLAEGDPYTLAAFGRHVHWGYWDTPESASGTAEEYGAAAERLCRELCNAARILGGEKLVDVGCGFGGTIASLNERYANLRMLGVNIDRRQLERAAKTITPQNGNSIDWLEADAARLPLPDAKFDVVLAVECIFHFDRPLFLAEAARILRPGGSLTLSDFVPDERAAEYLSGASLASDESIRWSYGQIDLGCSEKRYRELAQSVGLQLVTAIDITRQTLPTYAFLSKSTENWPDPTDIALFRRATSRLEKVSRKGLLGYKILRFEKPTGRPNQ